MSIAAIKECTMVDWNVIDQIALNKSGVRSIVWSSDGRYLAIAQDNGVVTIYNTTDRTRLSHRYTAFSDLSWCPDNSHIYASTLANDVFQIPLDDMAATIKYELRNRSIRRIATASDNSLVAIASVDGGVIFRDFGTKNLVNYVRYIHRDTINQMSFSPKSGLFATASDDWRVGLTRVDSPSPNLEKPSDKTQYFDFPSSGGFLSICWSSNEYYLASGARTGTILLHHLPTGGVRLLEGHTAPVISLGFSSDGYYLHSFSSDNVVCIWNTVSGALISEDILPEVSHQVAAFCPTKPVLAAVSITNDAVVLLNYSIDALALVSSSAQAAQYSSAKVVLVGESNVGKSCLALRLAEQRYEEQGTTHGMRLWTLSPEPHGQGTAGSDDELREIVLWDMGGQDEYRLVHQLFLHDTTIALILFDPTRGRTAIDEVAGWTKRLEKQLSGRNATKYLVATKLDLGHELVDEIAIRRLIAENNFSGYFRTSAKSDLGVELLRKAIFEAIDWNFLTKVTRPKLFQLIRKIIFDAKNSGESILLRSELDSRTEAVLEDGYNNAAVSTVINQLERV